MVSKSVKSHACFIAGSAEVRGNVTLKEGSSVWFNTTIRAESKQISIGRKSNIQDNCVIHVEHNCDVIIGDNVTIGHGAIIHGCTIEDNTMVGMGAIVMNRAHVGKNCIIAAGALVPEDMVIPDASLVIGVPGKIVRSIKEEEIKNINENAEFYCNLGNEYNSGAFD